MATQPPHLCRTCGHALPDEARFCPECGRGVSTAEPDRPKKLPAFLREPESRFGFIDNLRDYLADRNLQWRQVLPAALLTIFLLFGAFALIFGEDTEDEHPANLSLPEYEMLFRQNLQRQLDTPGNGFQEYIENIHVTVSYKGATVKSVEAQTFDGSMNAGVDGKNVVEVAFVITAYWDGMLQKDGYTEFQVIYDPQADIAKNVAHLSSSAVVNTEKIPWGELAATAAGLLLTQ